MASPKCIEERYQTYWPPPGMQIAVGPPAPKHEKPAAQSVLAAQGRAQRPVVRLQRCVPQMVSFWQGSAKGLGAAAGAAGAWGCP
jgi:hypothetical protein